jgi:predicted ATPase
VKAIIADDPSGIKDINLAFMGSGLSQLVPVIVQSVLTSEKGCLLVEQPEIHLHPAAQANLGDLFVYYAKRGRQFIIETHSEHLVLRIRRLIAEKKIDANLVRIFLVEKRSGESRIRNLRLKGNGHFENWPRGFFGEAYREAKAIAEAQMR